jgi:hypothetical protein
MSQILTAEAFGTLLALSELGRARMVEPRVRSELLEAGFAECSGDFLLITAKGRQLSETRDFGQVLGVQAHSGRRGMRASTNCSAS